ncbi:MAG: hypothetical protein AAFX05_06195, partial [Planctomycetota bacterium]
VVVIGRRCRCHTGECESQLACSLKDGLRRTVCHVVMLASVAIVLRRDAAANVAVSASITT